MRKKLNRSLICAESLANAVNGQSLMNYGPIFEGFMAMGIPESEIKPRENVFTYNAWQALGRQVKRGEHGVKVVTFIECKSKDKVGENGEVQEKGKGYRRPWTTTVFHISQTELIPTGDEIREAFSESDIDSTADLTIDTQGQSYAGEVL